MREKLITQSEKINDLTNILKKANTLFFVSSLKINRNDVAKDKYAMNTKRITLYKANVYRTVQIFLTIPFFKRAVGGIHSFFFIGITQRKKNKKKLCDIFNLKLKYMRVMFALQDKTFFNNKRLLLFSKLLPKQANSITLTVNSVYTILKKFYKFVIFVCLQNAKKCN